MWTTSFFSFSILLHYITAYLTNGFIYIIFPQFHKANFNLLLAFLEGEILLY